MLIAAGCDGVIIDPCEEGMMTTLFSSRAVLGLDEYCMDYISAYREERMVELNSSSCHHFKPRKSGLKG